MFNQVETIRQLRILIGCGLKEAHDVVVKYPNKTAEEIVALLNTGSVSSRAAYRDEVLVPKIKALQKAVHEGLRDCMEFVKKYPDLDDAQILEQWKKDYPESAYAKLHGERDE